MTHKSFSATAGRSGSATKTLTKPAAHSGACCRHARIPFVIVAMLYVGLAVTSLEAALMCQDTPVLAASNTMQGQVGRQVSTPRLVIYNGNTRDLVGHSRPGVHGMTFALYQEASGSAPSWMETQNVTVDSQGNYSVVLGITKPDGVPAELLSSGLTRWLGIQLENNVESPRIVFTSVPFAFHASSADSLANHAASEYVLAQQLQTASGLTQLGLTSLINTSIASQLGNNGNQYARLDVPNRFSGDQVVDGTLSLDATGTATAARGYASFPVDLLASSFNSTTAQPETKVFRWQVAPVRSNTATPSASLNLLYRASASATPALTGLSINEDGTINFAPRQKLFQFENASNFMSIQDAITAAGQSGAVLVPPTYTGTDSFVNPNNIPVIDLRSALSTIEVGDLPGIICDGSADASLVLNALTGAQDSISNRTISFRGCGHVRLDHQWVIRYQYAPTIDLSETQLLGCNGASGPMILVQRSIGWTITSSTRGSAVIYTNGGSFCGKAGSKFTGGIGTDNDFHTYPGGYTNTSGTLTNITINGAAGTPGFCGFCTSVAENQENFNISETTINCNFSQGESKGIGFLSRFAQNATISHNNVVGCMWGIYWFSPHMFVEYNNLTANGDWDIFIPTSAYGGTTSGAGLFCDSIGNIIRGNIQAEGSGAFLWARNDSGYCSGTLEGNLINGDWSNVNCNGPGCGLHGGHHVPIGQHMIEDGGVLYLQGNVADNQTSRGVLNTVPLIGDSRYPSGGSLATYIDLGNSWMQPTAVFDGKPPQNGLRHLSSSSSDPDVTTFDEIMQSAAGGGSSRNPPLKIWRTGTAGGGSYVDYAMTTLDDLYQQASNGNSFVIDVVRNDPGTPTGLAVRLSLYGGVNVATPPAIASPVVKAQGGGSGSTWGYKVVGISGGGTRYTTAEVTVSNAAILDSSHWSRIETKKMPGYVEYQLWLTTQPAGAGRTLGMIASFNTTTANTNCAIDAVQGCDGTDQRWYMTDKGQAIITAGAPTTTTADGRINIAAGSKYYIGGTALAASDVGALASSTQLAQSKSCKSTDKVSAYDAVTGQFACSADQTAGVTSVVGRTGDVLLTKSDVGLGNVENTSDANKPISTATQAALNIKLDKGTATWPSSGTITTTIASGSATLPTAPIAAKSCAEAATVAATGVVTTDVILWTPIADFTAVGGYMPGDTLKIYSYPATNTINFKVCNADTINAVTPGVVTLNWRVVR